MAMNFSEEEKKKMLETVLSRYGGGGYRGGDTCSALF